MEYTPDQRTMITYLYGKDPNCRVRNGKNFIYHFITSNIKYDMEQGKIIQEWIFFSDKNIAIDKTKELFEVLEDLKKIIRVTKYPDEKPKVKFILREPDKTEQEFIEFKDLFYEYYTATIEIIDSKKFDRFVDQGYVHDKEYEPKIQKRKDNRKQCLLWAIAFIATLFGLLATLYFGLR